MGCEWQVKLDSYVDGELSPEELAECEQHLRDCRQCATTVLGCLQMKRAIRAAATSRYAPTSELRLRIRQTISPAPPMWRRFWVPQFALAAAALVLLVVGAALWLTRPRPANFARELLDQHVATLASPNPVDVLSSDRHTVKPWFEGRLPFTFNLPDLQGSPFRLIGGRVTYLQQSPGAHLLFGIRKHQISVFILQGRGLCRQVGQFSPEIRQSGFTIDTWSQGGLCYALVGDTGPSDIHALTQLLQAAAPR